MVLLYIIPNCIIALTNTCNTFSFHAVLKLELSGSRAVFLCAPWRMQISDAVTNQPMKMAVCNNKCKYFVLNVIVLPFEKRIQCLEIALVWETLL